MKFVFALLLAGAFAKNPGGVEELKCDTCTCETGGNSAVVGPLAESAEVTNCKELCQTFNENITEKSHWDFYRFLLEITDKCKVTATARIPIELEAGSWCATTQDATDDKGVSQQRGWVMKKPDLGNNISIPKWTGTLAASSVFRIWQESADKWFCTDYTADGMPLAANEVPATMCPANPTSYKWTTMSRADDTVEFLEFTDSASEWAQDKTNPYFMIRSTKGVSQSECFGEVTKIEWQVTVKDGVFEGLTKLPETTSPTGFETQGVGAKTVISASLLVALLSLNF